MIPTFTASSPLSLNLLTSLLFQFMVLIRSVALTPLSFLRIYALIRESFFLHGLIRKKVLLGLRQSHSSVLNESPACLLVEELKSMHLS